AGESGDESEPLGASDSPYASLDALMGASLDTSFGASFGAAMGTSFS
ncbi:hypothetical protein Tco_0504134, partial [Tanacetum coccineum]